MKGKIPVTAEMILESQEHEWSLLKRGLIKQLETTALIELPEKRKVRIYLVIKQIIAPKEVQKIFNCTTEANLNPEFANGLSRILEYVNSLLENENWVFIGYIKGEEQKPIVISHYPRLNLTVYSQKLVNEESKNFISFTWN